MIREIYGAYFIRGHQFIYKICIIGLDWFNLNNLPEIDICYWNLSVVKRLL